MIVFCAKTGIIKILHIIFYANRNYVKFYTNCENLFSLCSSYSVKLKIHKIHNISYFAEFRHMLLYRKNKQKIKQKRKKIITKTVYSAADK